MQSPLLIVVVSAWLVVTQAFFVGTSVGQRWRSSAITMKGGRSLEEKHLTDRQLFKQLRDKLNEAAKRPGFLEQGKEVKETTLYVKATKDGRQVADCPFGQFVQMVLLKKGITFEVKPTLPETKPDWLVREHGGKIPALVHKDKVITESLPIAEYLEKTFPHNSLTRQGAHSYQEILERTAGLFPAISAAIKNKDPAQDAQLLGEVDHQLDIIDHLLRTTPGQYICGLELTLADLYLTPQLFHGVVALDHFKDFEFYHLEGDFVRPALESYLSRMFDLEEFNHKKAYCNVDKIVNGWKLARGDVKAKEIVNV